MSDTQERVTLREAVEQQLRDLAANKPGFMEQVLVDPKGTIEPIIRATLDDDGDLDLADIGINVGVSTPASLNFVIEVDPEDPDVTGFGFGFNNRNVFSGMDMMVMRPPSFGAPASGAACSGKDATCHTSSAATDYCGTCKD